MPATLTASDLLGRDHALAEAVGRVVATYAPTHVYLFGSHARGDAGPDSDYDLMVVVDDTVPDERVAPGLAYEALWGLGTPADVVIWRKSAFDARRTLRASLPGTVLREGVLLYDR
ncbi:MAG: nucleotidyltransferase domain-containing protein [Planctomycetota bacterium]|nr:nucleotidyltransferase domain-containing protein [Planctomycetota bacterium]